MVKWEYSSVGVKDEDATQYLVLLDDAGAEGWEFTGHATDTGYGTVYLMKRPLIAD